jgi:hypothetical protein
MRYPREQWTFEQSEVDSAKADARWLIGNVRNVVLATVNEHDNAHTTVLGKNFRVHPTAAEPPADPGLSLLFWSFPDTRHLQNIRRRPDQIVRVQLLRAEINFGALALHGIGYELSLDEIEAELPAFNAARATMEAMPQRQMEEFTDDDYPKGMCRVDFFGDAELPVRAIDPEGVWASDVAFTMPLGELLKP